MGFIRSIIAAIQGTVRYKLLVLVLFPIVLMMPIALALAIYWGTTVTYDQLFIKVNTDLSVSHDAFNRIRADYLSQLGRLAESHAFRTALEAGKNASIHEQLKLLKDSAGFSYLQALDIDGSRLFEPTDGQVRGRLSPMLHAAYQGEPVVGVEIFSAEDLRKLSLTLANQVELALIPTPRARPTDRKLETRAMMVRAVYPVKDSIGNLIAVLDGGLLLNGNFAFVDEIRDLVYGPGSLPEGSIGTVTVFLDDVRISTNVPLRPGERALGTRASDEVRTKVLDEGDTWIDRAFVVNDWYISSYEPIIDIYGNRVGMLYAGFLETPFRHDLWRALAIWILMFLTLMALTGVVAVQGAKSIFKPLEAMSGVVRATRAGEDRRVGEVGSKDEIGVLSRELDVMLDLLQQQREQIQQWVDQLEDKVAERTAELQSKNADLERTISVLQQTRAQLVVAEKLAALGELTAGVAHEINNPTAVILGNLDVLVEELGSVAAPVQDEIDLIIEQIYRIKDIINNLLQYARPDQYAGYLTEVDVNKVVHQTLKLVRHIGKEKHFDTRLELDATRMIQISQQELQQVLVNLVVNGIHALPAKDGCVQIRTLDWLDKGVVITVEDDGKGMSEEELSHIFNPFYTTKDQGEGSGLGLSVSYGLIRRYGGNITVNSKPGKGSAFSVWLLAEPNLIEDKETLTEQLHAITSELNSKTDIRNPLQEIDG